MFYSFFRQLCSELKRLSLFIGQEPFNYLFRRPFLCSVGTWDFGDLQSFFILLVISPAAAYDADLAGEGKQRSGISSPLCESLFTVGRLLLLEAEASPLFVCHGHCYGRGGLPPSVLRVRLCQGMAKDVQELTGTLLASPRLWGSLSAVSDPEGRESGTG